jgi:hypothetical protein
LVRLEHGHGRDGGWHRMEEVHDAAQSDQEREWGRHRIFRCTTCEDEIRIEMPEPGQGR